MLHRSPRRAGASVVLLALAPSIGLAGSARAAIVQSFDVGAGTSASTVQVDFSNGNGYLFMVRYDGSLTGLGALQLMAQQVPGFTLHTDAFPWGELVSGLGVAGDYEYGTGDLWPIENYWHYWAQNDAWEWAWSPEGASDRLLFDGSADAWVFGSGVTPQVVPGAGSLLVGVGAFGMRRKRR